MAERLGVSRNYVSMIERGTKEVSEGSSLGMLFLLREGREAGEEQPMVVKEAEAAYRGTSQGRAAGQAEAILAVADGLTRIALAIEKLSGRRGEPEMGGETAAAGGTEQPGATVGSKGVNIDQRGRVTESPKAESKKAG